MLQGEPEFDRLKRELEEVKNQPRGLEGTFRTAAEMERHRAQLADAAIEEQLEVQTAFREHGARLQVNNVTSTDAAVLMRFRLYMIAACQLISIIMPTCTVPCARLWRAVSEGQQLVQHDMLSRRLQALAVTTVVHNQLPLQRGSDACLRCDVMPHIMMHLCSPNL